MSPASLKYNLHLLIEDIKYSQTLKAIYAVLSEKQNKAGCATLFKEERKAVEQGLKDIENGNVISHVEAMARLRKKYPFFK